MKSIFIKILAQSALLFAKFFILIGESIGNFVIIIITVIFRLYKYFNLTLIWLKRQVTCFYKKLKNLNASIISFWKNCFKALHSTSTKLKHNSKLKLASIYAAFVSFKNRITVNSVKIKTHLHQNKQQNYTKIVGTKSKFSTWIQKPYTHALRLVLNAKRSLIIFAASISVQFTSTKRHFINGCNWFKNFILKLLRTAKNKLSQDLLQVKKDINRLKFSLQKIRPLTKAKPTATTKPSIVSYKNSKINATIFVSPKTHKFFIFAKLFVFLSVCAVTFYLVYRIYGFYAELPSPRLIGKKNFSLTTHITDRNGVLLYNFYKDQNRTALKINEIPTFVKNATIATEDKDFYTHIGISPISGVLRAVKEWFKAGKVQGGSTITQQLVKTSLLSSEQTFVRKIKEAVLALEVERLYSKNEILQMYLNQVPYGGEAYGIEEASRTFFGKSSSLLSLGEAALLAGLPQAPSQYSPFTSPKSAIARRNVVLKAMLDQGYINEESYNKAIKEAPNFAKPQIAINAPHFVFYVKDYLENYLDSNYLEQAGLNIKTTLDVDIQNAAQEILVSELDKVKNLNVGNGGILVVNPKNGEILAMVGSVGYFSQTKWGAYNVTTALRQPGSTLKPLLYLQALIKGQTANSIIPDTPTTFTTPGSTEVYKPVNYDGKFHGAVTIRQALANSYNIPAVKTLQKIGVTNFIEFLQNLGISTLIDPNNYGLSLSLGGGEVTMLDMSRAYGVLASGGVKHDVTPILDIKSTSGDKIVLQNQEAARVVPEAHTYIIADILSDNNARVAAFGPNSELVVGNHKVAVKTGTTNDKKDNWTIGYTPDYLVLVWVGNNDGQPMNPYLTSGITGAAPIWNRVMKYLLDVKNSNYTAWYNKPDNIVEKSCFGKVEKFLEGTQNLNSCSLPTPTQNVAKNAEKKDSH